MADVQFDAGSWITRGLVADGAVRIVMVEAAELAEIQRQAHGLTADATRLAAEAAIATVLLTAYVKGDEKLTLQLALTRPEARFIGEVDPEQRYRGRFDPSVLTDTTLTDLDGVLFAAKHDGTREVYRGASGIDHTSVTGALRTHLGDSSQVHGVLATGVRLDDDGRVAFAGGLLAERLPVAPGKPSLSPAAFDAAWGELAHADVEALVAEVRRGTLRGESVHRLEQRPVFWGCSCSRRRMLDALGGLSTEELHAMADEDGGAVADCHFCATRYQVGADELRAMAADRGG